MSTQPNEIMTIRIGRNQDPVTLEFYGKFNRETFGSQHMTPGNVRRVCLAHDALHSIALFMTQKETCDIAMHNYVPFSFPNTLAYTIAYTQRYEYPLLVTKLDIPVESLLKRNGCPTMWRRWCTRAFKEKTPRSVYKHFGLAGVTQVKGMTRFQSEKRAGYNPAHTLDMMLSQKTFPIYAELPIFDMTEAEQQCLADGAGTAPNPYTVKYGAHGCMFCPFKPEKYWHALKKQDPLLYAQCNQWRALSAYCVPAGGSAREYYYYPASKIM